MSQRRLEEQLENQVTHIASALSRLGPLLQQLLSLQANAQSSGLNPSQMPVPPQAGMSPSPPTFAQPSQANQTESEIPNTPLQHRSSQGFPSGSMPFDPLQIVSSCRDSRPTISHQPPG